jgi:hypothetical protein
MGVSDATVDAFYANAMLSPTDKSIIVEALQSLGGAGAREIFVAGAAKAPSIEMGFFYHRQAELIAAYNKRVSPIQIPTFRDRLDHSRFASGTPPS